MRTLHLLKTCDEEISLATVFGPLSTVEAKADLLMFSAVLLCNSVQSDSDMSKHERSISQVRRDARENTNYPQTLVTNSCHPGP
jgi:hypothetical protein